MSEAEVIFYIRECKELWGEIRDSGLTKRVFLETPAGERWLLKGYFCNCPLCHYVIWLGTGSLHCSAGCPLMLQFGRDCLGLDYDTRPSKFAEWVMKLKED